MTAPLMLRQLDREWRRLATSTPVRRYIRHLADLQPTWRLRTADQLIELARYEPDHLPSLLAVLIDDATRDNLAFRIAIQVMLPRWWTIASTLSGIPIDEAVALVAAIGARHIRGCDPATAGTPIGYRLWCNTRRDAIRTAVRIRNEQARTASLTALPELGTDDVYGQAHDQLRKSILQAGIDADSAELILKTRVLGASVSELADASGESSSTLRQRRRRAERRLASTLAA